MIRSLAPAHDPSQTSQNGPCSMIAHRRELPKSDFVTCALVSLSFNGAVTYELKHYDERITNGPIVVLDKGWSETALPPFLEGFDGHVHDYAVSRVVSRRSPVDMGNVIDGCGSGVAERATAILVLVSGIGVWQCMFIS